jgi:sigma-E factor negative regulatory protein RseC
LLIKAKINSSKLEKEMGKEKNINHKGKIVDIKEEKIKVSIIAKSACSGCHAKSACTMSDSKEKIIDIINYGKNFEIGEEVNVVYKESLGWYALFLGYVLPFILVFLCLILTLLITEDELQSGLASLILLIPYYTGLYLFKNKIKKNFEFVIEKIYY